MLMSYTSARGDLGDRVGQVLHTWLPRQVAPARATKNFQISEFTAPPAGYSGKTVFFTATWTDGADTQHVEELVLRTQADDHQLFTVPDAPRQAEVMRRLGANGVPVPEIVGIERDPTILGSAFYVMRRVRGRTPSDVPSWHKRGWTVDLSSDEREILCDNGLRALVDVHRLGSTDVTRFLADGDPGRTAMQRYLDKLQGWYDWCRPDLAVGEDTLARALRVILDSAPATDAETVVWGDARVGNMCFGDDLSVVALFDWETACTGPPDIDVGWWLMFERFLCEALGFTRLPGIPDDDEFVRRYLQFGGTLTGDIVYYQLVAAFVLSLINNRLARLLVRDGLDVATAMSYPQMSVALVQRYLDEV
jgi:aminoglycoside phosphotransferase (APT) family kinase protein